MKTAQEILKLELGYSKDGEIDLEEISSNQEYIENAMKVYARQALDEVKERIDGLDSLEPVTDVMQYIEDLKNELN